MLYKKIIAVYFCSDTEHINRRKIHRQLQRVCVLNMMVLALTTGLKEVKCCHHSLEFKACVYAMVMPLYHENAVNSHSVGGGPDLRRQSGKNIVPMKISESVSLQGPLSAGHRLLVVSFISTLKSNLYRALTTQK